MKKLSLIAAGLLLSAGLITFAATSNEGDKKQECAKTSCQPSSDNTSCDKSTCDTTMCPEECCPPGCPPCK